VFQFRLWEFGGPANFFFQLGLRNFYLITSKPIIFDPKGFFERDGFSFFSERKKKNRNREEIKLGLIIFLEGENVMDLFLGGKLWDKRKQSF